MKKFYEWFLNESVTFQVSDISSDQQTEDCHGLCWKLASKVRQMFLDDFSVAFESSRIDFYDLITPDGDYYSNGSEEINFYAGYFPEGSRKKILDAIVYLLPEFNMKLNGTVRSDTSSMRNIMVYRIPVISSNNSDPAPELNVSNANAVEILNMLNIGGDLCGSISVRELNMKLSTITDFHKGMSLRSTEKGSNFVSYGLDMKQLERYVDSLEKMVAWALKNNYDTISYC